MQFASPLDNLVGFEHAPRNVGERKRVDAALAKFGPVQGLFSIDLAAQCRRAKVEIPSAVLGLGVTRGANSKGQHANFGATFDCHCHEAAKAPYVEVRLFDAFAGITVSGLTSRWPGRRAS